MSTRTVYPYTTQVVVFSEQSGMTQYFHCDRWVEGARPGDGAVVILKVRRRKLDPGLKALMFQSLIAEKDVTVLSNLKPGVL